MQSSFGTPRIFNDQTGWYITLRSSDEKYLTGAKHKKVGNQHLMGPFNSKERAMEWLDGFVSMHGENRETDEFIPDSIDTHS